MTKSPGRDRTNPFKFVRIFDALKQDYVPIYISPAEHNNTTNYYKYPEGVRATVASALRSLNFPLGWGQNHPSNLSTMDVAECSKLAFLIDTLEGVRSQKCNLDLAIIASTSEVENMLSRTLNLYDFQFRPLSQMSEYNQDLYGALVRFRKEEVANPRFRFTVDCIIAYDSACILNRNFAKHFSGVYSKKPKVTHLVCSRSADLRICNYRDSHPEIPFHGGTYLLQARFEFAACFFNMTYPKLKVVERQNSNRNMVKRLVSWLTLKENTHFQPYSDSYKTNNREPPSQRASPARSAVAGDKRHISSLEDIKTPPSTQRRVEKSLWRLAVNDIAANKKNKFRSSIQTSFSLKGLRYPRLVLDDDILNGMIWLSDATIIGSTKANFSNSHGGKVEPLNYIQSGQASALNTSSGMNHSQDQVSKPNSSAGVPTINPERLAMIHASQPIFSHHSENNTMNDNTALPIQSMQIDPEMDSNKTPQESQVTFQSNVSINQSNDTNISNQQTINEDTQAGSEMAIEDLPEASSNKGLNDFEVALEKAHLELMRSLLGKEQ